LERPRACDDAGEAWEKKREAEHAAARRRKLWREIGGEPGAGERDVSGEVLIGRERDAHERGREGGEQGHEHQ